MSDTLIRDNKDYGSVGEFLKDVVKDGSELSVVSAYFTIFAYYGLHDQLDSIKSMKFLFGEPTFITSDNVDVRNYKIEEQMFEYGLLQDAGKVTAEIAKFHAETEFEKYRIVQDRLYKSDYDLFLEELEIKLEANKHGEKLKIEDAIKAVGSKSLSEAGIIFFSTLSYDTSLQARKVGEPVLES